MKKLIVLFVLTASICYADLNLQVDKVAHFGVGYITSDVIHRVITPKDELGGDVLSLVAVMAMASAKEGLIDRHFDWQDWGYTVLGGLTNITIIKF